MSDAVLIDTFDLGRDAAIAEAVRLVMGWMADGGRAVAGKWTFQAIHRTAEIGSGADWQVQSVELGKAAVRGNIQRMTATDNKAVVRWAASDSSELHQPLMTGTLKRRERFPLT